MIDGFFAPFYGGILLDRSLSTSASILLFTFKMLAEGATAVQPRGMGAISAQLAAQLPPGAVRVGVGVRSLDLREGALHGVVLDDGSRFEAAHVVLATDPSSKLRSRRPPASHSRFQPAPTGAPPSTTTADSRFCPARHSG